MRPVDDTGMMPLFDALDAARIITASSVHQTAISDARKAMEQGGADNIKKATEALTTASHKLAEVMYQNAGANAAGGGTGATGTDANASAGGNGNGKADDVIDAEVVDEHK